MVEVINPTTVELQEGKSESSLPVLDAETGHAEPNLSEGEKIAIRNYSMNYGQFLKGLGDLNGQAAKRVLGAIVTPGTDWQLHKYTTEHEKNMFHLAARLMDSKIIMMLAALQKDAAAPAVSENIQETITQGENNGES